MQRSAAQFAAAGASVSCGQYVGLDAGGAAADSGEEDEEWHDNRSSAEQQQALGAGGVLRIYRLCQLSVQLQQLAKLQISLRLCPRGAAADSGDEL